MTSYQVLVSVHGAIGVVALATFWSNAVLRKGTASASPRRPRVPAGDGRHPRDRRADGVDHASATGAPVTAAFLGYLVVITAAGVWSQWRAIRDQDDVVRYTGPVYVGLGVLSLLSGLAVLALGISVGAPLLMGFSAVGLFTGSDHLHKWRHRAEAGCAPRVVAGRALQRRARQWHRHAHRVPRRSDCRACCRRSAVAR